MEPFVDFLVAQGWSGLAVAGVAWLYVQERQERRAIQAALDEARKAHADAHIATIRETGAAIAAVREAIVTISLRGGGNG